MEEVDEEEENVHIGKEEKKEKVEREPPATLSFDIEEGTLLSDLHSLLYSSLFRSG